MSFRTTKVKSQNFPFRLSQHRGHRETLKVDVYSVWVLCRKLHSSSVYVRYWHRTICDSWICWKKLKTLQLCGPLATKDGVEGAPVYKATGAETGYDAALLLIRQLPRQNGHTGSYTVDKRSNRGWKPEDHQQIQPTVTSSPRVFLLATQADAANGFLFSSFKDKMSRRSSYQRRWWEPLVTALNTWPSTDPQTSNHSIVSHFPKERKVYVLQWLSRWWCLQYWYWGSLLQKWYVHWKQYSPAHVYVKKRITAIVTEVRKFISTRYQKK